MDEQEVNVRVAVGMTSFVSRQILIKVTAKFDFGKKFIGSGEWTGALQVVNFDKCQ